MLELAPAPCTPPCTQVGRQHELELATAELERAQERLVALEREKQQLVSAAQELPPAQGKQPVTAAAGAPGERGWGEVRRCTGCAGAGEAAAGQRSRGAAACAGEAA